MKAYWIDGIFGTLMLVAGIVVLYDVVTHSDPLYIQMALLFGALCAFARGLRGLWGMVQVGDDVTDKEHHS